MNYFKLLVWSVVFFMTKQGIGQDIHFSQYTSSPLNLNPALAGNFDGAYRFVGNERRQWVQVSPDGVPYQTIGMSADANNFIKPNIGAGISIYNDKDGYSKLNTLQVNLSAAYRLKLNKDSTQFITPGIQVGITQQNIAYTNLSFDNQYNGYQYVAGSSTNENFNRNSLSYINVNAGLVWDYKITKRKFYTAGISLYNITKPRQSFLGNNQIRLDRRFNFYALANLPISKKMDIIPSYLFMNQGKFIEFVVGGRLKYILNESSFNYFALYLGGYARTKDAGYVMVGADYNAWHFGASYDLNLSTLKPASNGRGGLEFAVIYIIQPKPPKRLKYTTCPDFI